MYSPGALEGPHIALWGPNISEQTEIIYTLKTGSYVQEEISIYPLRAEVNVCGVTIKASVSGGNEGSRIHWRCTLNEYNGIVYVVDTMDVETSKRELHGLLSDGALTLPILVLARTSDQMAAGTLRKELDFQEANNKDVALFMYSVSKKGWFLSMGLEGLDQG